MADPALQTAALAGLEFVVNKALGLDPATLKRLSELEGKVLLIHCQSPDIKVYCLPGETGVQLKSWHDDAEVNSSLSGKLSQFVQLMQADDKAAALINGDLSVRGNSQDFVALQTILEQLDIDWEQPIARVFGDVGGHQLGRLIRGGLAFGQQAQESLQVQLEQFLHQEAGVLPAREELESFYHDVGDLSLRVDRLQARIARTQQRLSKQNPA
ncbi:MAG: SCP2 sterol-binding domain-containing protein [Pseudomonadota bacterium]